MSPDPMVEDTRRKLGELEERIRAARTARGATGEIADNAHKDWEDMVRAHADIREKLDAAADPSPQVIEGIRLDVDVLRHSFERWMSRVEGNFAQDNGRGGRKGGG